MLYFFLSYARGDDEASVLRFFDDLSAEVCNRAGSPDAKGFLDRETIRTGNLWSEELRDALGVSPCFVALTSPMYYNSDYCGKEFGVFYDRLDEHQRTGQHRSAALMPVRWNPPHETVPVPEVVSRIQDSDRFFGRTYEKYGMRWMVRMRSRYRKEYEALLFELASRIVTMARIDRLPPSRTADLHNVVNAFADSSITGTAPLAQPSAALSGPATGWPNAGRYVHFVLAIADRDELVRVRENLAYYGPAYQDWAPYRPNLPQSISEYASLVAQQRNFASGTVSLDRLDELLAWARTNNQIVILIVDAFSATLTKTRGRLHSYDDRDDAETAVMVPWSSEDREIERKSEMLRATLRAVFPNKQRDPEMFRGEIATHEVFSDDLQRVLVVAQNRLALRSPEDGSAGPPRLHAP